MRNMWQDWKLYATDECQRHKYPGCDTEKLYRQQAETTTKYSLILTLLLSATYLNNLLDAVEGPQRNAMLSSARVLARSLDSLRARKLPHHLRLQTQRPRGVCVLAARAQQLAIWPNLAWPRPAMDTQHSSLTVTSLAFANSPVNKQNHLNTSFSFVASLSCYHICSLTSTHVRVPACIIITGFMPVTICTKASANSIPNRPPALILVANATLVVSKRVYV
jgi:hypothetical protein